MVQDSRLTPSRALDIIKNEDITGWFFTGHGGQGTLYVYEDGGDDESESGLTDAEMVRDKHHSLSEVVLFSCEAAQSSGWSRLVSSNGMLRAPRGSIRPIIVAPQNIPQVKP